jgi:hypothetical protein
MVMGLHRDLVVLRKHVFSNTTASVQHAYIIQRVCMDLPLPGLPLLTCMIEH